LLKISGFLVNYPFANRLFPGSLDVIEKLSTWGPTVILSDGDVGFQARARWNAPGCGKAVEGRVLILHPQGTRTRRLSRNAIRSKHYVLIDDKLRILQAVKKYLGRQVDHGVPQARPLRQRSQGAGAISAGRNQHRPHRRN
jgi:hypothetical protein